MSQYVITVLIAAALVTFIIYQQMRTRPVLSRQLVAVPAILALLGIVNLQKHPPDSTAGALALAASLLIAIVFGLARGRSVEIWRAGAIPMRRGTSVTLALWIVGIAFRVLIGAVANRHGVPNSVTLGELPLFLGLTLAVQNLLIWMRSDERETRLEGTHFPPTPG